MEPLTAITLIVTFIGVLVIGYAKFYERKISSGETWSDQKFGMFFIVTAGIMVLVYFTTGNTTFPEEATINALYSLIEPMAALFGLSIATITGGRILKQKVISPVVTPTAAPIPPSGFQMGFTVTPTYTEGVSPVPVQFKVYATQPAADHPGVSSVDIDWADGNSQNVPMVKGEATVGHTFSFVKNDKYTGHTFYPVFAFNGTDGSKTMFNIDGKGVEIWVQGL